MEEATIVSFLSLKLLSYRGTAQESRIYIFCYCKRKKKKTILPRKNLARPNSVMTPWLTQDFRTILIKDRTRYGETDAKHQILGMRFLC